LTSEQLSAGALTRSFDRGGNKIPGVAPNALFSRLGYDEPFGQWKGVGWFAEYVWLDTFFMENANLLKAPGYGQRLSQGRDLLRRSQERAQQDLRGFPQTISLTPSVR
jgi:hypothetical protein